MEEDEFNTGIILPTLIIQLRKILDQYPDDGQILKELIQNAEDAGATEVKFLYDEHSYGTDPNSLHHPNMAKYQGTALYAYNDALFKEEDWKGIRMLCESIKERDPLKVGYFGLGFKSVFHLTDLPMILSGERIGIIDPHQTTFSSGTHGWHLKKSKSVIDSLPDQFDPFKGLFGCTSGAFESGYYDSTLFRFPLRQENSALSDAIYDTNRMERLLDSFKVEAPLMLLFLNSVETIELYRRGEFDMDPILSFRVRISDRTINNVRAQRKNFLRRIDVFKWMESHTTTTFPVIFEISSFADFNEVTTYETWLVTNYYAGGMMSRNLRKLHNDPDLGYLPWVGVAMSLDKAYDDDLEEDLTPTITPESETQIENGANSESDRNGHHEEHDGDTSQDNGAINTVNTSQLEDTVKRGPQGQIFCFLPLPIEKESPTGLPVHVNSYFALEQNRRHLKWPNDQGVFDNLSLTDKKLLWNQCILRDVLPKAYVELIVQAIKLQERGIIETLTVDLIYKTLADMKKVDAKWRIIIEPFYHELLKYAVIYTSADGGLWVRVHEAIFNTLKQDDPSSQVILQALNAANSKVADVPRHLVKAVKMYGTSRPHIIDPFLVLSVLKTGDQYYRYLEYGPKIKLLKFVLKDEQYLTLIGLELLPLANGEFIEFRNRHESEPIYITTEATPMSLLPSMEDRILDPSIDDSIKESLMKAIHKGYTQLKKLEDVEVARLIPETLPPDWLQTEQVTWLPGNEGLNHPPREWLEHLWEYLHKYFHHDLRAFEDLPILPINNPGESSNEIILVPLSSIAGLVMKSAEGLYLDDVVCGTLEALGVIIIEDLPQYLKYHPAIHRNYIHTPSVASILSVLSAKTEHMDLAGEINEKTTAEQKCSLRAHLSRVSAIDLDDSHIEVLKMLPLFETLAGSGGEETHFVSINDVPNAAPLERLPIASPKKLLVLNTNHAKNLADILGVKQLHITQLLTDIMFPEIQSMALDPEKTEELMLYVLKHFHSYVDQDPTFMSSISNLAFVPKPNGMLMTPDNLCDPESDILQRIFLGEDEFPTGVYAEPTVLATLKEIGLKSIDSLSAEDIIYTASNMLGLYESGSITVEQLFVKSESLLEFFNNHTDILHEEIDGLPLYEQLMEVPWVNPKVKRPAYYPNHLRWFSSDTLCKPKDMKCAKYASIVGAVVPIVNFQTEPRVETVFKWDEPPSLDFVIGHLSHLATSYTVEDKSTYLGMVISTYNSLCAHDTEDVLEKMFDHRISSWVWHGEGFASVNEVILDKPFTDLKPYIHCLPPEVEQFQEFLSKCGIRNMCDLTDVLRLIKEKYDKHPNNDVPENELKYDLQLCVAILNELKPPPGQEISEELMKHLLIPTHVNGENTIRMVQVNECTFCDEEWLRKGHDLSDLEEDEEQILFVHPNIPNTTAEILGVPTLMSRMLDAEELDLSFGQSDPLTRRLKNLLTEYTDGFAVPKELIQNADDAGATEVKILYDQRENKDARTCLIDEGMRECQGPAIWAYNNAVFTDKDFENITMLSGATKEAQTDKIGRFGLGFNAIYNLTDVPSFISRHNIVIFDPHTTHLGKGIKDKSKPGIKIDINRNRKKLRKLGNQFKPFNGIFGCNLNNKDDGEDSYDFTLFRFPLRTKQQAIRSEICNRHYDHDEVIELLHMFIKGASSLLLFTQNVRKVTLYHLSDSERSVISPIELFQVTKKPIKVMRSLNMPQSANPQMINMNILQASTQALQNIRHSSDPLSEDVTHETPELSVVISVKCTTTESAHWILNTDFTMKKDTWLVTSCMGTDQALKLALKDNTLMPAGGVAVCLHQSEGDSYIPEPILNPQTNEHNGSVYCYLPLPIKSGLPVHINGAFAITSSRRHLCERSEDDKFDVRAAWNEALLLDAVTKSYIYLLEDLARLMPNGTDCTSLWPNIEFIETNCKHLLHGVYEILASTSLDAPKLFSDGPQWVNLCQAAFLHADIGLSVVGSSAYDVFRQCQDGIGKVVINLPQPILQGFAASGLESIIEEKTYKKAEFFREVFFPNILTIDSTIRDALMLNALKEDNDDLFALMKESPCIPVSPFGEVLKRPSELIHPFSSKLSKLFSRDDGRFPCGTDYTYLAPEILLKLESLGMKKGDLSWEETLVIAESIQNLPHQEACQKTSALISFLNKKLDLIEEGMVHASISQLESSKSRQWPSYKNDNFDSNELTDVMSKMRNIPFLPIKESPKFFPVAWKGNDLEADGLQAPNNLYKEESQNLVCCIEPILNENVLGTMPELVSAFFGFGSKTITVDQVFAQLDSIVTSDVDLNDRNVYTEVQKLCYSIYNYFQDVIMGSNAKLRQMVREGLQYRFFILLDGKFLRPSQLAFKFQHTCPPYLYGLSEDLIHKFGTLYSEAGVREVFEISDFVSALQEMHSTHNGYALEKDDLKLALRLCMLLNECMIESRLKITEVIEQLGTVYIPDARGILHSSKILCYNDPESHWLPEDDEMKFSHQRIPYEMSKQLGVNTKRQEMLKKHSQGIPFGQKEKLTNRLNRILAAYPCDKEILKEILQNADDAQATDVHFVRDPRQHSTQRVFEECWRPLQGPALCVYNNRPFTPADLDGIQNLGEGTKSKDPNKTGQYGIGFNCVYHLTDTPTFLTQGPEVGETLVAFDPHCQYVPGATPDEPGRRYDNVSDLRHIFTDVFPCYLDDKFDLQNSTMFRFPLRSKSMAEKSDLSNNPMTTKMLDQLMSRFKAELFDVLLFINNTESISLSDIDGVTHRLCNTYSVTVSMTPEDKQRRQRFVAHVKDIGHKLKRGDITVHNIPLKEVSYVLSMEDNRGQQEKWLITQRIGFHDPDEVPTAVLQAFRNGDLALLPRGGVAARIDPIDQPPKSGKVYCILPLPVNSNLPVYINGHFALEHEARRSLWQDEDGGYRSSWNSTLLNQVIAPAYVSLMCMMKNKLGIVGTLHSNTEGFNLKARLRCYNKLFPSTVHQDPYWKGLAVSFYKYIHKNQLPVLPVVHKLHNDDEAVEDVFEDVRVAWMPPVGHDLQHAYFNDLTESMGNARERFASFDIDNSLYRSDRSRSFHEPSPLPYSTKDRSRSFGGSQENLFKGSEGSQRSNSGSRENLTGSPTSTRRSFYGSKENLLSPGSPTSPTMKSPYMKSPGKMKKLRTILKRVLLSCGFNVFHSPMSVYNNFLACDVPVECISPIAVIKFFKSFRSKTPACNLVSLPCVIDDTPLKDEKTLQIVLQYCKMEPDFEEHLNGLPLLLKEDNQLDIFDEDAPKFMATTFDILPDCAEMFVHRNLALTIFRDMDPHFSNVFKPFDVQALAELLGFTFSSNRFWGSQEHVRWSPMESGVPTPNWLAHVWDFLVEQTDVVNQCSTELTHEEKIDSIETMLSPLNEWALIPAHIVSSHTGVGVMSFKPLLIDPNDHYLVPLGMASTVIDFTHCGFMSHPVRDTLRMLGVPELNCKMLDGGSLAPAKGFGIGLNSALARTLVATLEKPAGVLCVLNYLMAKEDSLKGKLQYEDCITLLKYFNDSYDEWANFQPAVNILKELPFHMTAHGDLIKLNGYTVYILPTDIPMADMDAWQENEQIVFLRHNEGLDVLHDAMNFKILTTTELYCTFILPKFHYLSFDAQVAHLQYLKDVKLKEHGPAKTAILASLNMLAFLPGKDGCLYPACMFKDPHHSVFKVMYRFKEDSDAFPPKPFCESKWLDFMRQIGLVHDISIDTFVDFAYQIAEEALNNPSNETVAKSKSLVAHLFKRRNVIDEDILERVKDIPFIAPARPNQSLLQLQQYFNVVDNEQMPFVCFNASVPETHENIIWTSASLLPNWANPFKLHHQEVTIDYEIDSPLQNMSRYIDEIASKLGIHVTPSLNMVVIHCQNLCGNLMNVDTKRGDCIINDFMKLDIMRHIYKFLQHGIKGDDPQSIESIEKLKDTECILVDDGQKFILPSQIVMSMYNEEEIRPFLYRCPTEFGEFSKLFKVLGVTETPSCSQYASVLENIHRECGDVRLHPNELRVVYRAVYRLFKRLRTEGFGSESVKALYLPSQTGQLLNARELVFNNDPSCTDRLKDFDKPFLVDLSECKLHTGNFEDMVGLLPEHLRPLMLTDLVVDTLEERCKDTVAHEGTAERLRQHLASQAFAEGIGRLIKHEHHRQGLKVDSELLERTLSNIMHIHLYGVEKVVTYLAYEGEYIPGSEMDNELYVEKTTNENGEPRWKIYIESSAKLHEELVVKIADTINRLSGGLLQNSVHYLQPIMTCQTHQISNVLDRLKIRSDQMMDSKPPTLPQPGQFVPIEDHHLLKEDFLDFDLDEYVAFEVDDPTLIGESGPATYVYGIVVEKLKIENPYNEKRTSNESRFLQRYKVNIGDDRKSIIVNNTDLYKFHRMERIIDDNYIDVEDYIVDQIDGFEGFEESAYETADEMDSQMEDDIDGYHEDKLERHLQGDLENQRQDDEAIGATSTPKKQKSKEQIQEERYQQQRKRFEQEKLQKEKKKEDDKRRFNETFQEKQEREFKEWLEENKEREEAERKHRQQQYQEQERARQQEHQQRQQQGHFQPPKSPSSKGAPKTAEQIKDDISDKLETAWTLEEKERKKIIKRLLLKWHPDKNIGNEKFATDMMHFIEAEIERICSGQPREGHFETQAEYFARKAKDQQFTGIFKDFFENMAKRAGTHKTQRKEYKENFSQNYSQSSHNFDVPPSFNTKNPQPGEAKRWMKQAKADLKSIDNDLRVSETAYEWACYKCHQAAEKALKASQLAVDVMHSYSHDLQSICNTIPDTKLKILSADLQKLLGDAGQMYYPDSLKFPQIPHDTYTEQRALECQRLASMIVERSEEYIVSLIGQPL
ncbi:unnamed protein product [Owenia fusiformis]|uniref:Uncharacterized protein n=1 Tax=Owenia fusiformis TaxID=6347 RepID=A0A8J1TUB4_OWEFU|nr:unnamed protein product [Owenia fusiformis]